MHGPTPDYSHTDDSRLSQRGVARYVIWLNTARFKQHVSYITL